MVKFKIKYKGEVQLATMPSNWNEVTLETFIRLEQSPKIGGNYVKLLSVLSGLDLPIVENTRQDLMDPIRKAIDFIIQEPPDWEKLALHKKFRFKGKDYPVPKDLELERFGQKILLQNALTEAKGTISIIPYAIALYMQPIIDGEFSSDKVDDMLPEVLKMPAVNTYPLAAFFFRKLNGYIRYGVKGLRLSP